MATVRLSYALREVVRINLLRMFTAQTDELQREIDTNKEAGKEIYERFHIPAANKIVEQLHKCGNGKFLRPMRTAHIRLAYIDRHDGGEKSLERYYGIPAHLDMFVPMLQWESDFRYPISSDMELYEFLVHRLSEITRLNAEHQKLERSLLDGVWDKCKSLAQVIEHWPSVIDFLDVDTRKQHYAKSEKREKVVIAPVDDSVKSLLVTNRLITST